MSNQGMRKECNFCGAKFGQGVKLCPNCGSANVKLVAGESMGFWEAVSEKSEKTKQLGVENKKTKKKLKKTIIILCSVLAGIFVLLVGVSHLASYEANKQYMEERENVKSRVNEVLEHGVGLAYDEWMKEVQSLLKELYLLQMEEEIVDLYEYAVEYNRPIPSWLHNEYATVLMYYNRIQDIWNKERNGEILEKEDNINVLYYCLEIIAIEESQKLTSEEKQRLLAEFDMVLDDVNQRWNMTEGVRKSLYAKNAEELGFIDYEAVKRFVNQELYFVEETYIKQVLKQAEGKYGNAWKEEMFPLLDELYKSEQDDWMYKIYYTAEDESKPIFYWEHYLYLRALFDLYDVYILLDEERQGKQLNKWEYAEILTKYFEFENLEERTDLSQEEKDKLMPHVERLREETQRRWQLSEESWNTLRKNAIGKYGYVDYEVVEEFSEQWLEQAMGYDVTKENISAIIISSYALNNVTWKKRIFPILDELYEEGKDKELQEIYALLDGNDKPYYQWSHCRYAEMLDKYSVLERIWKDEANEEELGEYDYICLLQYYLEFKHMHSLSKEERERLKPYDDVVIEDASARWDFSEAEWNRIEEMAVYNGGNVDYIAIRDYIEEWFQSKDE